MISALMGRLESQLTSVISMSSALARASEDRAKRSFMVDDIEMVQGDFVLFSGDVGCRCRRATLLICGDMLKIT
jgi:hypothetical protein